MWWDYPNPGFPQYRRKKKKKAGVLGFKSLCFYSCFMMKMKEKPWGSLLAFACQHIAVMNSITGHIICDNHQKIKGPG